MKKYTIVYSQQAHEDIEVLYYFIINEYKTYRTAEKYVNGLERAIKQLTTKAESFRIQNNKSLDKYETNVRRINYRKMTVIYTVKQNIVHIQRVIPQSLIID